MFEKYNIDDLFLGLVRVTYADGANFDTNIGNIIMSGVAGTSYWTLLKEAGEEGYIDLNNMRLVVHDRNPQMTSYTVEYIEPFRNYYLNGEPKSTMLSRRQALKEAEKHYDTIRGKYLPCLTNEPSKQKRIEFVN